MGGAVKSSSAKRIQVAAAAALWQAGVMPRACRLGLPDARQRLRLRVRTQKELAELSLDPPTNCSAGPKGGFPAHLRGRRPPCRS